jgi:hypothetical protein
MDLKKDLVTVGGAEGENAQNHIANTHHHLISRQRDTTLRPVQAVNWLTGAERNCGPAVSRVTLLMQCIPKYTSKVVGEDESSH